MGDDLLHGLEGRETKPDVILGIRPENLADAALVPASDQHLGVTFTAQIDVLESTGADRYVYFTLKGAPAQSAHLEELASDSGRDDGSDAPEQIVARLDAASQVKEGSAATLWLDARAIHVFDPETGVNLARERAVAASASAA